MLSQKKIDAAVQRTHVLREQRGGDRDRDREKERRRTREEEKARRRDKRRESEEVCIRYIVTKLNMSQRTLIANINNAMLPYASNGVHTHVVVHWTYLQVYIRRHPPLDKHRHIYDILSYMLKAIIYKYTKRAILVRSRTNLHCMHSIYELYMICLSQAVSPHNELNAAERMLCNINRNYTTIIQYTAFWFVGFY